MPCAILDESTETIIKTAMSQQYDANNHIMNLSDFVNAEEFKRQGLYVIIGRANVLRTIVNIIVENTPNIRALNLSDNKLNHLDPLQILNEKGIHSLKAVDLSKNKVRIQQMRNNQMLTFALIQIHAFSEINHLRGLDLEELVLEGNPFIDDFSSHATYIRFVNCFLLI